VTSEAYLGRRKMWLKTLHLQETWRAVDTRLRTNYAGGITFNRGPNSLLYLYTVLLKS
jgi:hypothetical protein